MTIHFNTEIYKNKVIDSAERLVDDLLNEYYQSLLFYSPVDTWTYKSWHIPERRKKWDTVSWVIENSIDYAMEVEKWFDELEWRPVNWHINDRKTIFTWVWAEVYSHAFAQMQPIFNRKINKFIKSFK